eukprot:10279940-Alexandrium_andersonii.AAC.1
MPFRTPFLEASKGSEFSALCTSASSASMNESAKKEFEKEFDFAIFSGGDTTSSSSELSSISATFGQSMSEPIEFEPSKAKGPSKGPVGLSKEPHDVDAESGPDESRRT